MNLFIFFVFTQNITIMIYIVGIICGLINGLFASGAGQILVLYLIFIKKIDTYKSRATSVLCVSIVTVFSLYRYITIAEFKIIEIIIVTLVGLIFGRIGTKLMTKLNPNILNLISGAIIASFSIYNLIKVG